MSKPSRSPVLFEVLNKGKGVNELGGGKGQSEAAESVDQPQQGEFTPDKPDKDSAIKPTQMRDRPLESVETTSSIIDYEGDRIKFSFSAALLATVLGFVIVALAASYKLGHDRGYAAGRHNGRLAYEASVKDEIQAVREGPVESDLLGDGVTFTASQSDSTSGTQVLGVATGTGKSNPTLDAPVWVRGNTYVVVQVFFADSGEDALIAKDFLVQRNIRTAIVNRPDGKRWLITTQGYNCEDAAQKRMLDQLLERVREAGRAFRAAGGRYGLEGYPSLLTSDSWDGV